MECKNCVVLQDQLDKLRSLCLSIQAHTQELNGYKDALIKGREEHVELLNQQIELLMTMLPENLRSKLQGK